MEIRDRYTEWIEGLRYLVYSKKQVTQKALAKESGIDTVFLNAVLKGRDGKRAGENLQDKLSGAIGMSYDALRSLGAWILDKKDPEKWTNGIPENLRDKYPSEMTEEERDIAFWHLERKAMKVGWPHQTKIINTQTLSEILSSLPASQKYQEVKDVLVAGIGIPELEADKLLMKHMGLPPDLAGNLPEEKQERFAHIWEYACVKNQGLKKTAYPADKESLLERYLKGELDDVALYLRAIDWLDELFGDGGEPK